MTPLPDRLVLALVRLYPRSWRMRYETEFRALMADTPIGWRKVIDVARAIGPEWARAARTALIGVDTWRGMGRSVGRFALAIVVAWALACAADFALRFNMDYYSSVWHTRRAHPITQKEIDFEEARFASMLSPDRHEIALSYKYAALSSGWNPTDEILVRPCCNFRWTLNSELRGLRGILETKAVFGWVGLVGCVPLVLLARLTTIGRAHRRLGRVFFVLLFVQVAGGWPWLTTSIHWAPAWRTLTVALEGAVLARALLPLTDRSAVASSTELVPA